MTDKRYLCLGCGTVLSVNKKLGALSCECYHSISDHGVKYGDADYSSLVLLKDGELVKKKSIGITDAVRPVLKRLNLATIGWPITPEKALVNAKRYVQDLETFTSVFGKDTLAVTTDVGEHNLEITNVSMD